MFRFRGKRAFTTPSRSARQKSVPAQEALGLLPSWEAAQWLRRRYYRRVLGECGEDLYVSQGVVVEFPERLTVGERVFINRGTIITARAPISIGADALIGPYVIINSGNHNYADRVLPINCQEHDASPIVVGSDVWIGAQAVVLKGVTLGQGCVIGARSVVTRDVPPYAVVAGSPARVIKLRGAGG